MVDIPESEVTISSNSMKDNKLISSVNYSHLNLTDFSLPTKEGGSP